MARGVVELGRRAKWCSYKRTTIAVCCFNLVLALYVLRSLYTSFLSSSSSFSTNASFTSEFKYTDDQIKSAEESIRVRKALEPVELVRLAKELKERSIGQGRRWELSLPVKQKLTNEILQRLKELKDGANVTEQRGAIKSWRAEKLKEVKLWILSNSTSNSSIPTTEAKMLETALESDWYTILEDIGLWMPADVINNEIDDKPENDNELAEEEIIPGPPLPPECHAELHTDYDGTAVRWGLTHHKESAADCCQACLNQARQAKPGAVKCNIWVYCPSESGCYSPDIYEHNYGECWLKQAKTPRLNFKDRYSESYRRTHPEAPLVVPWISGVVGT